MIALKSDYLVKRGPRWKQNKSGCDEHESAISHSLRRGLFYFLLFAFVVVSVYVIIFSPFLQVTKVSLQGADELQSGELEKRIAQRISGKYLNFIPKNNYILIFPGKIEKDLSDTYRKIASIEVVKKFPDSISAKITERKSLVIWCSGEQCFFVDEKGFAYAPVDFNSPDVQQNHLIRIIEDDGKTVSMGQRIMDDKSVQFAIALRESIGKSLDSELPEAYHVSSRLAEDLIVEIKNGPKLFVSQVIELNKTVETLETFVEKFSHSANINTLEYIDLRVENKIFYKRKGAEQENSGEEKPKEENSQSSQ